jgi:hypothetical protein
MRIGIYLFVTCILLCTPAFSSGSVVYTSSPTSTIVPLDAGSLSLGERIRAGVDTKTFVISPDGRTLYAGGAVATGSNPTWNIVAIDRITGERLRAYSTTVFPTENPPFLALSPDGHKLLTVTCPVADIICETSQVLEFDTVTGASVIAYTTHVVISGLAFGADPATFYVSYHTNNYCPGCATASTSDGIDAVDATTFQILRSATFPPSFGPTALALAPDGRTGMLSLPGPSATSLAEFDTATLQVLWQLPLPNAMLLNYPRYSANGTTLAFTITDSNNNYYLQTLQIATMVVSPQMPIGLADDLGLNSDGTVAYLLGATQSSKALQVIAIDTVKQTVIRAVDASGGTKLVSRPEEGLLFLQQDSPLLSQRTERHVRYLPTAACALWYALTLDGSTLYSVPGHNGGLFVTNTLTGRMSGNLMPDLSANAVAVTPDGSLVFAVTPNLLNYELTVLKGLSNLVLQSIPLPLGYVGFPAIVMAPDGIHVYARGNGALVAVNTQTLQIDASYSNATGAALAIDPSGRYLYSSIGELPASGVLVVDLQQGTRRSIPIALTTALAAGPDSRFIYGITSNSNGVYGVIKIDVTAGTVVARYTPPSYLPPGQSIAVSADGTSIYVSGSSTPNDAQPQYAGAILDAASLAYVGPLTSGNSCGGPIVVH